MKNLLSRLTPGAVLLLVALPLLVPATGCVPPQFKPPSTVWPAPPDPPRVKYEDRITGSRWLQRRKANFRFRESMGAEINTVDLFKPYDIAVDARGRIFISDTSRAGVLRLDPVEETFKVLAETGPGAINKALAIDLDPEGNLYAIDVMMNQLTVLDPDGEVLASYDISQHFVRPSGLAVDAERGRIFVSDVKGHKIGVLDMTGEFIFSFGARGTAPGEFNLPTHLALGKDGSLYVSDTMNFRIQHFDAEGNFLRMWGQNGAGPGAFHRLKGIAVDNAGNVWATDASSGRVQVFTDFGRLMVFFSSFGKEYGQLSLPSGIALSPDGRELFVAAQMSNAVEYFTLFDREQMVEAVGEEQMVAYEEELAGFLKTARAAERESRKVDVKAALAALEARKAAEEALAAKALEEEALQADTAEDVQSEDTDDVSGADETVPEAN